MFQLICRCDCVYVFVRVDKMHVRAVSRGLFLGLWLICCTGGGRNNKGQRCVSLPKHDQCPIVLAFFHRGQSQLGVVTSAASATQGYKRRENPSGSHHPVHHLLPSRWVHLPAYSFFQDGTTVVRWPTTQGPLAEGHQLNLKPSSTRVSRRSSPLSSHETDTLRRSHCARPGSRYSDYRHTACETISPALNSWLCSAPLTGSLAQEADFSQVAQYAQQLKERITQEMTNLMNNPTLQEHAQWVAHPPGQNIRTLGHFPKILQPFTIRFLLLEPTITPEVGIVTQGGDTIYLTILEFVEISAIFNSIRRLIDYWNPPPVPPKK